MGSEVVLRKGVIDEIVARAAGSPVEVCGLLIGEPYHVRDVIHCTNVATNPATRFEIDPAQLIAPLRAARAGGPRIVGCYHSHPGGPAAPSPQDAADAEPNGWLWLIAGEQEVTLHRAVAHGCWHGRFDPIAITRI